MNALLRKFAKVAILAGVMGGLYAAALHKHAERDAQRRAPVELTVDCKAKLEQYALSAGSRYRSPHLVETTGQSIDLRGYSDEDIRAIQRGCNIIDDMQGQLAQGGARDRWNSTRFSRSSHASCDHCHRNLGDKHDEHGRPVVGSNGLAASWVMADMYDRFTGLLLPYELRQMQCYINSSNGFKPNAADDLIRDVTAYSRFLSAALHLRIGHRYPEQGMEEIPASATMRRGDDYVRGSHLFREKCAACHGTQAQGTVVDGRVLYPALAGPESFSLDSRMNFARINSVMPGFICRNMPPGAEGSLDPQECRDIAYYLSTLPRPAGDRQGPLVAAWQQLMMTVMPPLTRYADHIAGHGKNGTQRNAAQESDSIGAHGETAQANGTNGAHGRAAQSNGGNGAHGRAAQASGGNGAHATAAQDNGKAGSAAQSSNVRGSTEAGEGAITNAVHRGPGVGSIENAGQANGSGAEQAYGASGGAGARRVAH